MKNFLKRFERLENQPVDYPAPKDKLTATKRFERLEINDRQITFTLHDQVASQETAPLGTDYIRMCPYCGAENPAGAKSCAKCKHDMLEYYADYGGKDNLVKKCACGAINLKERKCCWVCGRDFSLWGDSEVEKKPQNLIVLTIDGKTYRSDDEDLPPGIVELMEKIRRQGYSKELVDEWVKEHNAENSVKMAETENNVQQLRWDIIYRIAILFIVGIVIYFTFVFESGRR